MNVPIPQWSLENFAGAIADVVRASALWGQEVAQGKDDPATSAILATTVGQLVTLVFQRDPTEAEIDRVFAALGSNPLG